MNTEFRFGKKRFYDDQKFKRGFSKSGDFTLLEAELLSLYGETMRLLAQGEMLPEGNEEQRFLLVCNQQLEASTKLEKVWLKYQALTSTRRRFHTLNSSCSHKLNESEDEIFIEDE